MVATAHSFKNSIDERMKMSKKELLFSVTKKDLTLSFFSGKGAGGQHRNRHKNCVRLLHNASGVKVVGQSHKEKQSNIREAFKNLVKHPKFKVWHNMKVHEAVSGKRLEKKVEEMMNPENLKIEGKGDCGGWCSCPDCLP